MSIFLQCDIVEHSGHGVPIVVREYGEKAYKFNENSIIVTIPFDRTGFEEQNVHQNSLIIIKNLIENNPQVTLNEMAEAIGKTVKTVQRLIKDSNCIEYVGSSKKGYWKLKKQFIMFIEQSCYCLLCYIRFFLFLTKFCKITQRV